MTSPYIDDAARVDADMHATARDDAQAPAQEAPTSPSEPTIDEARYDAAAREDAFTLTVEQILQRLDLEGVSRPKRRVQEWLQKGLIDARKVKSSRGIIWLANEIDTVRFIEELKRKEAIGIAAQHQARAMPAPERHLKQTPPELAPAHADARESTAVLEERVTHLEAALTAKSDENAFLREQVRSSNDHVKLWSDRAKELKDLLQSQTDNTAPMLAAMANAVEARVDAQPRAQAEVPPVVDAREPHTEEGSSDVDLR